MGYTKEERQEDMMQEKIEDFKKEFNLSEKIDINDESVSHHNPKGDRDQDFILVSDVKEFIKRLKEELCCLYLFSKDSNWEELEGGGSILIDDRIQKELAAEIDKLAGDKLI